MNSSASDFSVATRTVHRCVENGGMGCVDGLGDLHGDWVEFLLLHHLLDTLLYTCYVI